MLKAFCLTCSRQTPWRTERAAEEFRRQGLTVEFFQAIHGATWGLRPHWPSAIDHKTLDWFISTGHVGLCLSHYMLWAHLWHSGIEQALIFEDDAVLVDDFADRLTEALRQVPADWDIVYVGGKPGGPSERRQQIAPGVIRDVWPYETHAMLLRQSALPVLLARFQTARSHVDQELSRSVLPHLKHYMLQPALCSQFAVPTGDEHAVRQGEWQGIPGWFDFQDIYDEQAARHDGGTFVEVGSWFGRSAAYLATQIKRRAKPIKLHCVDTFAGSPDEPDQLRVVADCGGSILRKFQQHMAACGVSEIVTPVVADSVDAASRYADRSLEFVFIDDCHAYESVRRSTQAWAQKVKRGGTFAGHDIGMDGVRRAVTELGIPYREQWRSWLIDRMP